MAASGYGGKGLSIVTLTRGSGLGAFFLGCAFSAAAACPPAGLDKAGLSIAASTPAKAGATPEVQARMLPGVTAALKSLD